MHGGRWLMWSKCVLFPCTIALRMACARLQQPTRRARCEIDGDSSGKSERGAKTFFSFDSASRLAL